MSCNLLHSSEEPYEKKQRNTRMNTKAVAIVRWVLVLPVALVSMQLVWWCWTVLAFPMMGYTLLPVSFNRFLIALMASACSGIAYIRAGQWCAPAARKIVGWVLAVPFVLMTIVFAFYQYGDADHSWQTYVCGGALVASPILTAIIPYPTKDG